jgi:large subunit ribosomal protein L30
MVKKKEVKVQLIRSLIGRLKNHKACAKGLGLSRINSVAILEDTPSVRGMINKIHYLLSVEEV